MFSLIFSKEGRKGSHFFGVVVFSSQVNKYVFDIVGID